MKSDGPFPDHSLNSSYLRLDASLPAAVDMAAGIALWVL